MSWDYRVAKRKSQDGDTFVIHEVGYDDNGNIENITYDPILPVGDDITDLRDVLMWMLEALEKPILELPKEISNQQINVNVFQIFSMKESDSEP